MSLSIAECRKARGNAKGCITRTGTQASHDLNLDSASLDLAHIVRMRDSLSRADDNFQVHHEILHDEHEQMEEDDYFHELDEHNAQVSRICTRIKHPEARLNATKALAQAETSLSLLELTAKDGFTPELLSELPETKELCKAFHKVSSSPLLSKEPLIIKSRETLSSRVSTIYNLCLPHMPSASRPLTSSTPTPVAASVPNRSHIKAVLPKFDGQMLHWKAFWRLFESTIKDNSHLNADQRRVLLLEAMTTPESIQLAREALAYTVTYEDAAARLRENYEDDVELHVHHVTHFFKPEVFKNTRVDLYRFLNRLEEHTAGIQASNGFTVEQVMASYASTLLSPALLTKWKEKTGACKVPPTLATFQTFIKDMIHMSTDPLNIVVSDELPLSSSPQYRLARKHCPSSPPRLHSLSNGQWSAECVLEIIQSLDVPTFQRCLSLPDFDGPRMPRCVSTALVPLTPPRTAAAPTAARCVNSLITR